MPNTEQVGGRFFYGWVIVLISSVSSFASAVVGSSYVLGVFLKPMGEELGWTRATLSGGFTICRLIGGLAGPLIGHLADRKHGARLILAGGAFVVGSGIIALSQIQALWHFYLIYGIMGLLGLMEMGDLVTSTVIAKWFIKKRSLAMAITIMGMPVGSAFFTVLSARLISMIGWRLSWMVLGLFVWVLVILPAVLFIRRQPEDVGLVPDGLHRSPEATRRGERLTVASVRGLPERPEKAPPLTPEANPSQAQNWTLSAAFRTPTLWVVMIAFAIAHFPVSAMLLHTLSYLTDIGFPAVVAAAGMTTMAISSALSKPIWGFLAQKVNVRHCAIASFVGSALSIIFLLNIRTSPMIFLFAIIYGFTYGGFVLLAPLTWANYYGRAFLGSIQGAMAPVNQFSLAAGPVFAGYIYDVTRSYGVAFGTFIACLLLAAFLMLIAKPPIAPTKGRGSD